MADALFGPEGQLVIVTTVRPAGSARLVTQAREMEKRFRQEVGRGGFVESTNRQSLHWIQAKAVENLRQSIATNRRPDFQTHRLENAIVQDRYSRVTPEKVEFLIRSAIFQDVPYYASLEYGDRSQIGRDIWFTFLGVRNSPGGNLSSDHRRNFNRAQRPSDVRNNRNPNIPYTINKRTPGDGGLHESRRAATVTGGHPQGVSDRIIGPREYASRFGKDNAFSNKGRVKVIIRRPVPRYAYGQKAGASFVSQNVYKTILKSAAADFLAATGVKVGR